MSEIVSTEPGFSHVAHQIMTMARLDQEMRARAVANHGIIETEEDNQIDIVNTEQLKKIIAEVGWPTVSKVGADAAHDAWPLVQHADHDVAWQKHCLALMQEQPAGEVSAEDIAYLEDRIRVNEGRPQLYGTQFHEGDDGSLESRPIEALDQVDERRKRAGMEPLADYVNEFLATNQNK